MTRAPADPNLHTHVAISSKVVHPGRAVALVAGRACAVPGTRSPAVQEHYNTRLEALLSERAGVVFTERGDAVDGKREVREIAGLPHELLRAWSSRRAGADIEAELAYLSRRFQQAGTRPPGVHRRAGGAGPAGDALDAGPEATNPRSEAEQRRTWQAEAAELLPWRGPGRSPRTAGHRPHDGSGRRRRGPSRRDSDRHGARRQRATWAGGHHIAAPRPSAWCRLPWPPCQTFSSIR